MRLSERERLESEIDKFKHEIKHLDGQIQTLVKENEALRAALEQIARGDNHYGQLSLCEIARKAPIDKEGK